MSTLTLAQANRIIEVALAKAREMKVKPLSVAVLDAAGHVRSMQREDGASMFRNDVAIGKAWAAVGMGVASRNEQYERFYLASSPRNLARHLAFTDRARADRLVDRFLTEPLE